MFAILMYINANFSKTMWELIKLHPCGPHCWIGVRPLAELHVKYSTIKNVYASYKKKKHLYLLIFSSAVSTGNMANLLM